MELVHEALQIRLRHLRRVGREALLQRAGEIHLRLHAPRRPREELGLDGELFRADVERVEVAHGRGRWGGHGEGNRTGRTAELRISNEELRIAVALRASSKFLILNSEFLIRPTFLSAR